MIAFFTQDLQSKLLALVFACLVWLYINREITDEVTPIVPVQVEMQAPGILVTDITPRMLRVTLTGPKETLFSVDATSVMRAVRLTAADELLGAGEPAGVVTLPAERFLKLPSGVTLGGDAPVVRVSIARGAVRTMRLRAQITGEPAPGFRVAEVVLDPTELRVRAPIELFDQPRELTTLPIDVSGRGASDSPISTYADLPRELAGHPIEPLDSGRVRVRIVIARQVVARQVHLRDVPVYVTAPAGFAYRVKSVDPPTIDHVYLEGPPEGEAAVREGKSLRIYVELDSEDPALIATHHRNLLYPLRVRGLPPGYKLIRCERELGDTTRALEKVTVVMEKKK